jgi:large subunit ribosomal protein L22
LDPSDLYVKTAYVDSGMAMKRISPAPMGRAYRIRKRSNHITIVVAAREQPKKVVPKTDTAAGKKKASAVTKKKKASKEKSA